MTTEQDELTCTCDDSMWCLQLYVDGTLLDERLIDTSNRPVSVVQVEEARREHFAAWDQAKATGHHARAKIFCPGCGGGSMFDTEFGAHVLPTGGGKPQMLHLVLAVDPSRAGEPGLLEAKCGHWCGASERTHLMLEDEDFDHVIYCITCFNEETN